MKRERMRFAGPVLIAAVIGIIIWANAGDLTPPPGTPSPTMKTLTQVEPRTPVQTLPGDEESLHVIDQPGSYYLTGNITGESGKNGISIGADNVTLDLNGFALIGVPGSLKGVTTFNFVFQLKIYNGTVRDWGGDGIKLFFSDHQLSDLRIHNNGGYGLSVQDGCVITRCTSDSNGTYGIAVNGYGVISNCTAYSNDFGGITAGWGCTITDCTASSNGGSGIYGDGSTISNCTAAWNKGHGIHAGSGCLVVGNTCYFHNGDDEDSAGIYVNGVGARIEGNNVTYNNRGIHVDFSDNLIIRNSASGNTTSNYDIVASNAYGPIVNVAGVGDISATPNANHPWANFEH